MCVWHCIMYISCIKTLIIAYIAMWQNRWMISHINMMWCDVMWCKLISRHMTTIWYDLIWYDMIPLHHFFCIHIYICMHIYTLAHEKCTLHRVPLSTLLSKIWRKSSPQTLNGPLGNQRRQPLECFATPNILQYKSYVNETSPWMETFPSMSY